MGVDVGTDSCVRAVVADVFLGDTSGDPSDAAVAADLTAALNGSFFLQS
jgi:hypothetical protein